MSRSAWSAVVLAFGLLWIAPWPLSAQEKPQAKTGRTGSYRRLPPGYKEVVTEQQRETIYKIQDEFGPKLAELKGKLAELQGQQQAKIEAVLMPEQKAKLQQIKAGSKRQQKRAAPPASTAPAAKP